MARFDWNASLNTMLGLSATPSTGMRTSLVVAYEAALALPVSQLDEIQLGRFWSQSPSDEMLDVLIPTTIEHLRRDLFGAWGTPTFILLARPENFATRPEHEPAFCALLEAWAPRLVAILRERGNLWTEQREVADAALEAAQRYPSALFAFENAYRAVGDRDGVATILGYRARRATTPAERIALLTERARLREDALDLAGAQHAWLDVLRVDPDAETVYSELLRLFALDPDPPWRWLLLALRSIARETSSVEPLRRAADLAATKLDDPDLAAILLAELRRTDG